jgi:hypothetical protein
MVALGAYSDKTCSRTLGSRPYYPMMLQVQNQNLEQRRRPTSKALLGYIPHPPRPASLTSNFVGCCC